MSSEFLMVAEASCCDVFAPGVLAGRVALITGAGSGIGLAIARRFAQFGARVVLVGRRPDPLADARRLIEAAGGEALNAPADVRDFPALQAAVEAGVARWGQIDVLINNAGGNFIKPTAELSPNGWRTVIDIDLNGTFHGCKAAYPHLKASRFGGRIISIITDKARTGWPGCAHASAAKAGIVSLTRSLAQEWGPDGIRANTVAPGPIAGTEGADRLYEQSGRVAKELATIPLGRFGAADDIAAACIYLASDAGIFINGAGLVVDGGRAWHAPSSSEADA
ncbi:MAG TPA: SDR family oxidoreductase [Roseiarcus sp.]|nr:SDR family oxidoreductase [Roseiarcus sp.]